MLGSGSPGFTGVGQDWGDKGLDYLELEVAADASLGPKRLELADHTSRCSRPLVHLEVKAARGSPNRTQVEESVDKLYSPTTQLDGGGERIVRGAGERRTRLAWQQSSTV